MSTWFAKILMAGGLAVLLYSVWAWERSTYAAAQVKAALDPIKAEAARVKGERDQLAKDKQALADQAVATFEDQTRKDKEREQAENLRRAADRVQLDRLRASAVTGGRRVDAAAANTCSAEHQQRDERFDGLLAEGQRMAIEGAELVAEARSLVSEGERGLGRAASLIELANAWGRAVRLGERP